MANVRVDCEIARMLFNFSCQVAEKMEWIDDIENSAIPMQHGGRRFSFELETKIFKKRPLYLYCELDACKMDSNYPGEDLKMVCIKNQSFTVRIFEICW